jgi:hypothetical protein
VTIRRSPTSRIVSVMIAATETISSGICQFQPCETEKAIELLNAWSAMQG